MKENEGHDAVEHKHPRWMGYTQSDGYQPSADGLCLTDSYPRNRGSRRKEIGR